MKFFLSPSAEKSFHARANICQLLHFFQLKTQCDQTVWSKSSPKIISSHFWSITGTFISLFYTFGQLFWCPNAWPKCQNSSTKIEELWALEKVAIFLGYYFWRKNCPQPKSVAQVAKFCPIWSHCWQDKTQARKRTPFKSCLSSPPLKLLQSWYSPTKSAATFSTLNRNHRNLWKNNLEHEESTHALVA